MRKGINHIIIVATILSFLACGRKIVPAKVAGSPDSGYGDAAFNTFYIEAIKQKLLGNGPDALKYFEQCLKLKPQSSATYYQMAQILLGGGDIKNGKNYALKALNIDTENIWYMMMVAGIYYQEHNIDSAIVYYEKAVKDFPEKESLQLTLGNLYSERGSYDKANTIFSALDKKYGVNESSTVASIRNLMAGKKYQEALGKAELLLKDSPDEILYNGLLAEIYRGMGESEKAEEVYKRLLERNPDDPQTQLSLCDFLISEKSYSDLFELLNTVILNDKITREDKITLVAHLLELDDLIKSDGNKLMIAVMVLEANYPGDDIIMLLRPDLLEKQGDLEEASIRLEEIIKISPGNYYAWEKLLLVYLQMEDFNKLMIRGEECATRFNRSFLAKLLYAQGALENGKYSVALEELRKAEILAGNDKDLNNQVLVMKADVYYRMKDYDKAFGLFEEAVKANSEDLTVLNNYAYYLAEQDMRLKEAEKMAKKVIETEKNNNTFLDTYGWVLYKRGKLKDAAKIMEEIIKSADTPDAEYFEHYGYILKKQRKCEEAIKNWEIAISIDSSKVELQKEIENCRK